MIPLQKIPMHSMIFIYPSSQGFSLVGLSRKLHTIVHKLPGESQMKSKILYLTILLMLSGVQDLMAEPDIDIGVRINNNRKFIEFTIENFEDRPVECDYVRQKVDYIDADSGLAIGFRSVSIRDIVILDDGIFNEPEAGRNIIEFWQSQNQNAEISNYSGEIKSKCDIATNIRLSHTCPKKVDLIERSDYSSCAFNANFGDVSLYFPEDPTCSEYISYDHGSQSVILKELLPLGTVCTATLKVEYPNYDSKSHTMVFDQIGRLRSKTCRKNTNTDLPSTSSSCENDSNAERDVECKQDYSYDGKTCVRDTPECPSGEKWNSEEQSCQPIRCPWGLVLIDDRCELVEQCPAGMIRLFGKCVSQCKEGETLVHGICKQSDACSGAATISDPDCRLDSDALICFRSGGVWTGKRCIKNAHVDPDKFPLVPGPIPGPIPGPYPGPF